MSRGGAERQAGSRLRAVSTEADAGLEPTSLEVMTGAEVRRLTNGASQASLENVTFERVIRVVSFINVKSLEKLPFKKAAKVNNRHMLEIYKKPGDEPTNVP